MAKKSYVREEDSGYEELKTVFRTNANATTVDVGILERAGRHKKTKGLTVAQIAAFHEFGAPKAGIPQRSFMRAPMEANAASIEAMTKKLTLRVLTRQISVAAALEILGAHIANLMKQAIQRGLKPPLKPATIKKKKSSKPLIDTGQLISSIGFRVNK